MNDKIRTFKLKFRRFRYLIKWFFENHFNQIKPYLNYRELDSKSIKKSLILAPHADDEWIGNSQILSKTFSTVYYFQFLGNNYSESNKTTRRKELENLQKKINFDLILSDNYEDYSDLENLILTQNFSDIFIPFPIDWHQEHIKVNTILYDVLVKVDKKINLKFYHISVPFAEESEGCFLPITKKELIEKNNIFSKIYQSQYNTPIRRLNFQQRLNAKGFKYYALENYLELDFEEWTDLLTYIENNYETNIKKMIFSIDNLTEIRRLSNQVYTDWKLSQIK
ncbi:Uncharacterised protein [Algoriella xinjiangensis]|uniref:large ribosomal subunit protein bL28 n=1 Tax=Algoriella xinjiangensis TaxID=684065 RepID=UPI000F63E343|nr:bL28 family ribosomal protein [Algoriella xinjiangensis]VDH17165.1 Uncharacterised protein [Algoriella xinjiangensis]